MIYKQSGRAELSDKDIGGETEQGCQEMSVMSVRFLTPLFVLYFR